MVSCGSFSAVPDQFVVVRVPSSIGYFPQSVKVTSVVLHSAWNISLEVRDDRPNGAFPSLCKGEGQDGGGLTVRAGLL